MEITLETALTAAEAARRKAAELGVRVSVAIVDDGGHLVLLTRMDGAFALSPEIAEAKASGAAAFGQPGDRLAEVHDKRPGFFAAVSEMTRRPFIPGLGSVLVKSGEVVKGAIGVSGARPEQDVECAEAALAAIAP